jgi:hypothetical protein
MLKKQLLLYMSVFGLLLILSCRKKQPEIIEPPDPPCENGSCCWPGTNVTLYKRLKGESVFYGGSRTIVFEVSPNNSVYRGFAICSISVVNLPKVPLDETDPSLIKEYRFKVFGRMYKSDIIDFGGNPVYFVAVDRLEEKK